MAITQGSQATVTATLKVGGAAINIPQSATVTARLYAADGATPIGTDKALAYGAIGANWPQGVVVADFSAVEMANAAPPSVVVRFTMVSGAETRSWSVALAIVAVDEPSGSALFTNKAATLTKLRRDRLMMAARGALPSMDVSDDYLWDKLRAAESEIAHTLRVPLAPTAFFPSTPTNDEITALNGMPWAIDPGYDYEPASFSSGDKWGMLKLRNKPIQSVSRVRFAYPGGPGSFYDLPLDWLRMDRKYGTVQFVPSSTAFVAPLNAFVMQAIGNGRTIPLAIQLTYVAGLTDAARDYPELIDVIMKKASLKIIEDAFLPQSGSISADGLSQSMSNDMDKHHDTIDRVLNGGKGSNGGLMAAIHGIRLGVM